MTMKKVLHFAIYLIYHSITSPESRKNQRQLSAIGTITAVAGTGTSGYTGDGGLATSLGNIFIADNNNHEWLPRAPVSSLL